MAAEPQRAPLHVVETTGEVVDLESLHKRIAVLQDELDGANRDVAAWRVRYAELKREKEQEARADSLWPEAVELFRLYCHLTGTPGKPRKLTWNAERFYLVRPFLKKHGTEMCQRAIIGRVSDHFSAKRANGTTIHYHEWERIFGSKGNGATAASNFEESCNRAPVDWQEGVEAWMTQLGKKKSGPTK